VNTKSSVTLEEVSEGVALVTLRRPASRNAIDPPLARDLEAVVLEIERTSGIYVAILTGEGQAFCAGADLRHVAAGRLDDCFTDKGGFAGFVNADRSKLWIAAVNGPALAGGFEIVLACDMVVASTESYFALPEVKRGLIASAGGLYRLPRILPRMIAMELITTGRSLSPAQAMSLGVINAVEPPHNLLARAKALADKVKENAPLAVRESIRIARQACGFDDLALRKETEDTQVRLQRSQDYVEGALAFIEKRPAKWKGS
jgi:enoyl-CoA hydratase/carnithine racemase